MTQPIDSLLSSFPEYTRRASGVALRPYQSAPFQPIFDSILNHRGDAFTIVFPRQSGKDEFLLHLTAYLLDLFSPFPAGIIFVNPTYKPQTLNTLLRFDQLLQNNPLLAHRWRKHGSYIRRIDQARVTFLSGDASSSIVGATASLLLIVNEAQDISPALYQHRIHPMLASTNATRIFAGTLWTSATLLSQEIRHARYAQSQDGHPRLFMLDADQVRLALPPYGAHVDAVVARWGRQHPLVKTQYFNEEIDASSGMFTPARMALIFGTDSPSPIFLGGGLGWGRDREDLVNRPDQIIKQTPSSQSSPPINSVILSKAKDLIPNSEDNQSDESVTSSINPSPPNPSPPSSPPNPVGAGHVPPVASLVFLLDLAGQDEALMADPAAQLANPARDAAALSIVQVDTSSIPILQYPTYTVIHRLSWTGLDHLTLYGQLVNLIHAWNPLYIVIDATGVGEGLWSMLAKAFPSRLIPVKFTASVKSDIGYRFLAIIDTGRFRIAAPSSPPNQSNSPPNPVGATHASPSSSPPNTSSPTSPPIDIVILNEVKNLTPSPSNISANQINSTSPPNTQYLGGIEGGLLGEGGYGGSWGVASEQVRLQYQACQSEVLPGPSKTLRWGVPDGTRNPDGLLIHDDFVLADSLVTQLDLLDWYSHSPTLIVDLNLMDPRRLDTDLLRHIDRNY